MFWLSKFLLSIKIKIKIIEHTKCFCFLFICRVASVWNEGGVVYTQVCLTRFKRSALFSPNVASSMENYLNHLAKVLLGGGRGGGWRVEGGLLIRSPLFKTLCWIRWRLSQPSPKAVLHLLRSPSGQVRVGNPRRSRALAQSCCRGGSFFLWMRVQ